MADNDLRQAEPVKTTGNQVPGDPVHANFDHAIPMSDDTAEQQDADLSGAATGTRGGASAGAGASAQGAIDQAKQAARDGYAKYGQQATDKVRAFAETGKERAGGALDQVTELLNDAAAQVEAKLGAQYGGYARQAADTVQGLSDQVKNKDIDEFVEDVRGFVRKSPAVAIGAAAAVGFVLARIVQSGIEDAKHLGTEPKA